VAELPSGPRASEEIEPSRPLRELSTQVAKGDCILFLGAGIHAPPPEGSRYAYRDEHRPPLGAELVNRLARDCGLRQHTDTLRLDEAFQRLEATLDRLEGGELPLAEGLTAFKDGVRAARLYSNRLREAPSDLQRVSLWIETATGLGRKTLVDCLVSHLSSGKRPSPALQMLAALPFRIIVTTNFDGLLESALKKFDKDPAVFVYSPHSLEATPDMTDDPTVERPMVFKIHGDLARRDSIVITDEDYITFTQRMSDKDVLNPVPQTIRFRMLKWPTLFVGYSLRDYNLRLLFRTLRWRVDPANFPPSFSVDKSPDPLILQVWQNQRRFVTFVTQDLWTFVPWLYEDVSGREFPV
jgi:exodeoxyribonuclease VII small subunit